MPTITTVDATWTNAVANDDGELRRADTAMFLGDGSNNGVRGGIVYHGPNSLAVAVNGSDQVSVQAGAWVIPAATGLGVYRGSLPAATAAVGIASRNATNPRIDLVVIQAPGIVKTIDGTPAASPTAPGLPAQHIEIGRLNVPATGGGAVTVDSTWRSFAAGLGSTLYVPTFTRLTGSGHVTGQRSVALDTGLAYVWDGTTWQISPTSAAAISSGGDFNISTATAGSPVATSVTLQPGHWVIWGKGYSDNGAAANDHTATIFNATSSTELDRALVTINAGAKASWSLMANFTLTAAATIQLRMWPSATGATQLMNRVKLTAQRSGI